MNETNRPPEGPARHSLPNVMITGLRRRREAALRLPPLADGHRDPLDRAEPHIPTATVICGGEFGLDGKYRAHCGRCTT